MHYTVQLQIIYLAVSANSCEQKCTAFPGLVLFPLSFNLKFHY